MSNNFHSNERDSVIIKDKDSNTTIPTSAHPILQGKEYDMSAIASPKVQKKTQPCANFNGQKWRPNVCRYIFSQNLFFFFLIKIFFKNKKVTAFSQKRSILK
jgi:hypothetical protein